MAHIRDNVQVVAEMVLDRLPKSSRVDCATDISKENSITFFGNIENTFDLRPEDLSTKGLERGNDKSCKQNAAYQISV